MSETSGGKAAPEPRDRFAVFRPMVTRWMDNDVYGHVNNVVYYAWFDAAVNAWLIEAGLLDPADGAIIGLVVETGCSYFASVAFPEPVEVGLRVGRIGRSSVTYECAIFRPGDSVAVAQGRFVHVYVGRPDRRPVDLPDRWRDALQTILRD